jgi:hypothetical protein
VSLTCAPACIAQRALRPPGNVLSPMYSLTSRMKDKWIWTHSTNILKNAQDLSQVLIWSQKSMSRSTGKLEEESMWSDWGVRQNISAEWCEVVLRRRKGWGIEAREWSWLKVRKEETAWVDIKEWKGIAERYLLLLCMKHWAKNSVYVAYLKLPHNPSKQVYLSFLFLWMEKLSLK